LGGVAVQSGRCRPDRDLLDRFTEHWPTAEVVPSALEVAGKLAAGPQWALRWTKRSLNNWLKLAAPIFESSLAMEMLNFFGPDVAEGARAVKEKRPPVFPSAR
jgi:enoyl-CoA hydratase